MWLHPVGTKSRRLHPWGSALTLHRDGSWGHRAGRAQKLQLRGFSRGAQVWGSRGVLGARSQGADLNLQTQPGSAPGRVALGRGYWKARTSLESSPSSGFQNPVPVCPEGCGSLMSHCPQRCSGRGQGGCWGRVKRFLPPARAVEEPPRLVGWCKGWFSSCAPSVPWTEPLSQDAPREDLPRVLSCVPLTFGARSP